MAVIDIFKAVDAQLALLYPGAWSSDFGAENVDRESVPTRMVWIPSTVRFDAAMQANAGKSPRSYATAWYRIVVKLWATDTAGREYEGAELLLQNFVRALYAVPLYGRHAAILGDATWIGHDGDLVRLGRVLELTVEFGIPLTEAAPATANVTTVQQTNQMAFADGQTVTV